MPLYARAAAPEKFRIEIKGPTGIDFTQVIGVTAEVVKPGGARATWVFGIEPNPSAQRIWVSRVFSADARDLPTHGDVQLGLRFEFPGNIVRRAKPISEPVLEYLGA